MLSKKIDDNQLPKLKYWADSIAEYVISLNPEKQTYTIASGVSASGDIHFGNFRDVVTSFAVAQAIEKQGKKVRHIYSLDNFDRLRKLPHGLPESYSKYIGCPLSKIPSEEKSVSYSEYFEKKYLESLKELKIDAEIIDQTKMYEKGVYDDYIISALQQRKEIAKILLSFMTDKAKQEKNIDEEEYISNYYPVSVYSEFSNKDATEIIDYDGDSKIKYRCSITDKESEIDIREKHIVKLAWKVDWAVRWIYEDVCFEPGGQDHASPSGSYDVTSTIAKQIFNHEPPVFSGYGFVGISGGGTKMSWFKR